MATVLISDGRVWNGESFQYADVLTNGKSIVKIEPNIKDSADFVFDAKGMTVSTGLVDAHVHMRGISTDLYGMHAESGCFPFGVTAAADASGEQGDRALLDSFMLKNAVFVCARFKNNKADLTEAEGMTEKYGDKVVGIKVYFDATMSDVTDISPLREVCDYARKKRLCVMVHCSHSPVSMAEILNTLGEGDILTHAFHGGANSASEDGFKCLSEAQKRGVIIDVGMAGFVHTDFSIFKAAIEQGIKPQIISSDLTKLSAFTRGGRYGLTTCMSIARALGMNEDEVFRAVTSAPAKALGKENEWGYLQAGRNADIAVFEHIGDGYDMTDKSGNRITGKDGYRCVLTLLDGQVVYRR